MGQSEWLYKPSREIKNLRDLELEKQRLNLHQKFLGELLQQDKIKMQKSLRFKNILSSLMFNAVGGETKDGENFISNLASNSPYGKVFRVIKWIFKTIFLKK